MSEYAKLSPLRLALIGCGEHSLENLVPCLAAMRGITVVAACDPDFTAASEAARQLHNCEVQSDFLQIFDRNDLDAIVVAATPQVHFHAALKALHRGLHVFVEKPPTVTHAELHELARESTTRKLVTCVGHNLRHATAALEMQSLIEGQTPNSSDGFGRSIAMEMRYFASKPRGDRWSLGSPLRSFMLSHANHAIDFMIYQMGPISKVNAALASGDSNSIGLSAQFVFRNGAVGTLLATSGAPHFTIAASIVSDRNHVVQLNSLHEVIAHGFGSDRKRWGRCWNSKTLLTGYEAAGYSKELAVFVDAVRQRRPDLCHASFADELAVYETMDEIEHKIQEGNGHDTGLFTVTANQ